MVHARARGRATEWHGPFFRLPLMLLELLLRRVLHRGHDDAVSTFAPDPARTAAPSAAVPEPPPAPTPAPGRAGAFTGAAANGAPPPTADEADRAPPEREAARPPRRIPAADAAARRSRSDTSHVDREAEVVESFGPADDVGDVGRHDHRRRAVDGYADMPATAVVARLRGADPATKGVVALYERRHKNRATVLRAAR